MCLEIHTFSKYAALVQLKILSFGAKFAQVLLLEFLVKLKITSNLIFPYGGDVLHASFYHLVRDCISFDFQIFFSVLYLIVLPDNHKDVTARWPKFSLRVSPILSNLLPLRLFRQMESFIRL